MNDTFLEGRAGVSQCNHSVHTGHRVKAELSAEWVMSRVGAAVSAFRHGENCPLCLCAIGRHGHRP